MTGNPANVTVAGVDGCKAGWIAMRQDPGGSPIVGVYPGFDDLLTALPSDAIVAVDMPIGLPEVSGKGGRGPEALVRPLLGQRQSSVFAIPSRAAVYADTASFSTVEAGMKRIGAPAPSRRRRPIRRAAFPSRPLASLPRSARSTGF